MDYEAILKTLGSTAIVVAAIAWLFKSLISIFINKDLEQFKSNLKTEAAKIETQFITLHTKRAEIIAELYELLFEVNSQIQIVNFEFEHREIREDIDRKFHRNHREEWSLEAGVDTLNEKEESEIELLREATSNLFNFYKKYRLYFTSQVCEEIDKFLTLTSYMQSNYRNIALKDTDGNLLVNPKVKEMWDKANEIIPYVLQQLEAHFRKILGVHNEPS